MPAHLVTPRWEISDSQDLQTREQDPRLDAKGLAQVFEAENISASGADHGALEPGSDLDELAAALSVLRVHVSQVTSNRVFEDGQQKFEFALDDVISPDQVRVLSRQQESGVECFFVR
ncbi:MAG: hypothetical protein WBV36_18895 [Terriglobales bacterium]